MEDVFNGFSPDSDVNRDASLGGLSLAVEIDNALDSITLDTEHEDFDVNLDESDNLTHGSSGVMPGWPSFPGLQIGLAIGGSVMLIGAIALVIFLVLKK